TRYGARTQTHEGPQRQKETRRVIQFLGVPYARPPIGALRFEAAQPADWTGTVTSALQTVNCLQPGDGESSASSEDCLYLNIFTPAARVGPAHLQNPFVSLKCSSFTPGLLDGSALAAMGNIVVVTASYRTAALGFLRASGLRGNFGLTDQEAVLRWVNAYIPLVGGDYNRVTVGAERGGADITSLHLLSKPRPLFHSPLLQGGSVFSPSLVQTSASARRRALDLAQELGCVTSDSTDEKLVSCLRAAPYRDLNAAQTKVRPSPDSEVLLELVFGAPLYSQRFTSSDRRLSLAAMSYVSSFIRTGSDLCLCLETTHAPTETHGSPFLAEIRTRGP
uniref:Carboxylesterase type B domain-containing protein n=1 Tax=Oryzias latipes TaxID=8090 RepID=A0A3P9KKJ3_ORYLA